MAQWARHARNSQNNGSPPPCRVASLTVTSPRHGSYIRSLYDGVAGADYGRQCRLLKSLSIKELTETNERIMDPLSQAALGAAAAQSGSAARVTRHALWIGALAGMAPDLDVFIRSSVDPLLALEFHRQFTHSLLFIPIGSLICAIVFYPLVGAHLHFKQVWLFAALGYGTHGLLDACTTYGTPTALAPHQRTIRLAQHFGHRPATHPASGCASDHCSYPAAAKTRGHWALLGDQLSRYGRRAASACALRRRANRCESRARTRAARGQTRVANLLVWKAIYEFDGRYYVDGIRVGIRPSYFPGESVAKLDVSKDFPWLNPSHSKPGISSAFGGFRIIGWLSITTMGT